MHIPNEVVEQHTHDKKKEMIENEESISIQPQKADEKGKGKEENEKPMRS